jgi:predicted helicase
MMVRSSRPPKRLYMTATPRIYGDTAKAKAETDNVALCSMDDAALYGKERCTLLPFPRRCSKVCCVITRCCVLSVEESHVSRRLQGLLER